MSGIDTTFAPLSEILDTLEKVHGVRFYPNNLQRRRGRHPSILDELREATPPLARQEQHGQRVRWLVSTAAIPILVQIAASARPGPPPEEQLSLNAAEVTRFVRYLSDQPDPAGAILEAAAAATGRSLTDMERLQRVTIPVSPRPPRIRTDSGAEPGEP